MTNALTWCSLHVVKSSRTFHREREKIHTRIIGGATRKIIDKTFKAMIRKKARFYCRKNEKYFGISRIL
jgi:hypothetical protein